MLDFATITFSDAVIAAVRVLDSVVEIDYLDWQDRKHILAFQNAISCCTSSPHGRSLSHGEVEKLVSNVQEFLAIAEHDAVETFSVFSFVEAWDNDKIVKIVAQFVVELD